MDLNYRKNRKAISVVMTTLIILVASVVLGTGVVLYGTSLFQTGGQTQSISTQGVKIWVNGTNTNGFSWGAAAVRNSGDVLATINTIQVRGVSLPYANWYVDANQTRATANYQANFNFTKGDLNGNPKGSALTGAGVWPTTDSNGNPCTQLVYGVNPPTDIVIQESPVTQSQALCLLQQTGPVTLNPGAKMIVYFHMPTGLLGPIDSGSSVTVNIYAGSVGGPTTATVANP